jgi:hypothetical protein
MSRFKRDVAAMTAALGGNPTQLHANATNAAFRRRLIRHLEQVVRHYTHLRSSADLLGYTSHQTAVISDACVDAEAILKALRDADTLWLDDANVAKLKSKL